MPVNALIPMSFQPTQGVGVDVGAALQGARQGWDIEKARQALGQINALKDIFSQPGAIGPDGQPTRETLQKVWAASPDAGLALQQNMLTNQQRELQTRVWQSKMAGEKHDLLINAYGSAANAYDDTLERTHNQEEAQKAAQGVLTKELQPGVEGGLYTPQEVAAIPPFDRNYAQSVIYTPKEKYEIGEHKKEFDIRQQEAQQRQAELETGDPKPYVGPDGKHVQLVWDKFHKQLFKIPEMTPVNPDDYHEETMSESGVAAIPDEEIDPYAKMIANYQVRAPSVSSRPGSYAYRVMNRVRELNPNYQVGRFEEVNKTLVEMGPGHKPGDLVRSLNVGIQHLGVLNDAATALHNGDIKALNGIVQWFKTQTGQDAPTNMAGVKQIVATEINKSIAGYAGAEGDRERLMTALANSSSPTQLYGIITKYKQLMAGQLRGMRRSYESATGFGPDSDFAFNKMLDPETLKELDPPTVRPIPPDILQQYNDAVKAHPDRKGDLTKYLEDRGYDTSKL